MAEPTSYHVNVRKKSEFLQRVMTELAGNAFISLEGDLSQCRFNENECSREETTTLKRNTLAPKHDFVVVKLTSETVAPIFKNIIAAGLKHAIKHIQIERNGVLELGAYDHFHEECVVTGPGITPGLLDELRVKNIVRKFEPAKPKR